MQIDDVDENGINLISLVADPAIERKGVYFAVNVPKGYKRLPPVHDNCKCKLEGETNKKKWVTSADCCEHCVALAQQFNNRKEATGAPGSQKFSAIKSEQKVFGPALIPNYPIYRRDADGNEYYVTISSEQIKAAQERFHRSKSNFSINLEHTDRMVEAFITESYIKEDSNDKSVKYGFTDDDCPVGTWFICVKILDADFFANEVVRNEINGFSIEGFFGLFSEQKNESSITNIIAMADKLTIDEMAELVTLMLDKIYPEYL